MLLSVWQHLAVQKQMEQTVAAHKDLVSKMQEEVKRKLTARKSADPSICSKINRCCSLMSTPKYWKQRGWLL